MTRLLSERNGRRRHGPSGGRLLIVLVMSVSLVFGGVASNIRPAVAQSGASDGVHQLTGTYALENPDQIANTSESYMLLLDMTAFIKRDREMQPKPESEIIAPLVGDISKGASFDIPLPVTPLGTMNDVGNGSGGDQGVQIYSVEYWSNNEGGPFIGPYDGSGWGQAESSLKVHPGDGEVNGGTIAVWAPDANQAFPTGFGPDGKLFTKDDPTGKLPSGWTVVDLNQKPFKQIRTESAQVEIVTGDDAFSDYSKQTYVESFKSLITELKEIYAYTDEKHIDFDGLEATYLPEIQKAQDNKDSDAFQDAVYRFSLEFHDGHTSSVPTNGFIADHIGGRLGMRIKPTDDGTNIVVGVAKGLAADKAGIKPGAEITAWDGGTVAEALAKEEPVISASSAAGIESNAYEFLTRGAKGDKVEVSYQNPGDAKPTTVTLTFGADVDGADVALNTAVSSPVNDADSLPIWTKILPSGVGYIRVNTFFADPILFTTAWNYAIRNLSQLGATGFVIDVRGNGGGYGSLADYAAGTFFTKAFTLDEQAVPDGNGGHKAYDKEIIKPVDLGVTDQPVAVLTGIDCYSACELFTAAMSHNPEHLIVSFTNTAGVEAGVYSWQLSGGLPFQASYVRLESDGHVFLEGYGVTPNVRIPANRDTLVVTDHDVALDYADKAVVEVINGGDPRNQEGGDIPPGASGASGTPEPASTPDLSATPGT